MAIPAIRVLLHRRSHKVVNVNVGTNSSLDEESALVRKKKRKKKGRPTEVSDVLRTALTALDASADACPPLKSVTGALVHIVDILEVRDSGHLRAKLMSDRLYRQRKAMRRNCSACCTMCRSSPICFIYTYLV